MAEVLLFHHALGLTPGVRSFAERLRSAGHEVATPDLFEGARFASVPEGVAHAEEIGFDAIVERGMATARGHSGRLVAAGFSLGALPAQALAQTNTDVVGAVLYHSAVPPTAFGDRWPAGVALQVHLTEDDPWAAEDREAAPGLVAEAGGKLYLYPGSGHLVAEPSSDDHTPDVAELILRRTLAFLDAHG